MRLLDVRKREETEQLDALFEARMRVNDAILCLNDLEVDYARSMLGEFEALSSLRSARDKAKKSTSQLKTSAEAIEAIDQLIGIYSEYDRVLKRN